MIARLTGQIADRGLDHIVLDVHGVGYLVYGPASVIASARQGDTVTLHTHLVVREDSMTLFGFLEPHQQRLFQTLIGVSGVGPKVALALLSLMDADELSFAIASGNAAALARPPALPREPPPRAEPTDRGEGAPRPLPLRQGPPGRLAGPGGL